MNITTIGLDLAKNVFQVHAVDQEGLVIVRKQLRRPMVKAFFAKLAPCLVGMEACGSAHHWARELKRLGHDVRLMPPQYVKPYVKRGKNDATDAEAICEAVTRPSMRFVPIKATEQQAVLMLHRTRDLLVRQRTMLSNAFRGHLSEFGIIAATGMENISKLIAIVKENKDKQIPKAARTALRMIIGQLRDLKTRIDRLEKEIITLPPKEPAKQASGHNSRHRPHNRIRPFGHYYRCLSIQLWQATGGLARTCPKAELQWWQRQAWQDYKARGPISPATSGHWSHIDAGSCEQEKNA